MPEGVLYGGIDPSGSSARPSGVAVLDGRLQVVDAGLGRTDEEIVGFFTPYRLRLFAVGLDGPCVLPIGLHECCFAASPTCDHDQPNGRKGRFCELELARRGIGCFFTVKNSFAKGWVLRSLRLYRQLCAVGLRVVEIYPYATKRLLLGAQLPAKQTRRGRLYLGQMLSRLGVSVPEDLSHHELDAIVAAYTVYLLARDLAEMVGDEAEGYIVIPKRGAQL
ncbi:MAG: DUF429 domain-containing protein [candidate division KSB1 bacterium]|nr:DUF429 domain-containing protein [candidate division KSB1 bacterium]MDZ7412708.1 DUF429 domain-containing protein [candidate division KSB1 bacterium]